MGELELVDSGSEDQKSVGRDVTFKYKGIIDRIKECLRLYWWKMLAGYFLILGSAWAVVEILESAVDIKLYGAWAASIFFIVLFLCTLCWGVIQYYRHIPEGFENQSREAIRLAHLRPKMWEPSLILVLFKDHVAENENEYNRIVNKEMHIPKQSRRDLEQYLAWSQSRNENLMAMIDVFTGSVIRELLFAMSPSDASGASPIGILKAVERVSEYCSHAVDIEREHASIVPPEHCEQLHKYMARWASPVIEGVKQMRGIMEEIRDTTLVEDAKYSKTIDIPPPPNVDKICMELDRIDKILLH